MSKIGMIGLGYWGNNILRNLSEMGVLATACDTNRELLRTREKEYPNIKFTDSIDDVLKDNGMNAVVISSPAVTHYDLAKKILASGKDIFVEKPLALTLKEGEELVRLAADNKKIIMVGHILQYHPAVIKLKEIIKSGKLGKMRYLYSNRLNMGKLRVEENILWSFAPHDISIILMLVGDEPVKVGCAGGCYLSKSVYDTTVTTMEFSNDIKSHIFVSWLHPYKEQKLIVVGSEAMAVFDDMTKEKLFIYPHKVEWQDGKIPVAKKAEYYTVELENKEPLREELAHFIECVAERKTPRTDGREGLRVLKVLEKAEGCL
ncbi:MAG: Gfo/Idh/MocA family oxidoreductase [Candidatus Omnitrophica bacterium]|nr:Gfo/Idh/MocA family oxidoreductase [Candidatus Omnitrophota bacterium]